MLELVKGKKLQKKIETMQINGNGHKLTLKQRLIRYLLKDAHIDELHIGAHSIVIDGDVIKMNPLGADPGVPAEGWIWHLAGTTHKPRFHDGTTTKDIGEGAAPGAHDLAGAQHNADTLANLNAKVSDATLDDSSATRTPTAHKASHQDGGADEISLAALDGEPATLTTHKAATTGVHGAGANTLEHTGNRGAASGYAPLGADSKIPDANSQVPSTHPTATTGVHGVGASTVESVSGSQGKVDTHAALTATHGATGAVVGTTNTQELSAKTLNNAKIKDVDATPVGDVLLKVLDGVLKARNAGDTADANMTVAQMSVGDVLFKNGWRLTEDEELGIVLVSPKDGKFRMIEC